MSVFVRLFDWSIVNIRVSGIIIQFLYFTLDHFDIDFIVKRLVKCRSGIYLFGGFTAATAAFTSFVHIFKFVSCQFIKN